jgi:hypothetical protein
MSIKQFNAGWSKKEDRITLNINTSEGELFRFWITRFIAKHLLEGAQTLIQSGLETKHNPRASQVIQEFQKDAVKQQLNLNETFEGGDKKPLGDDPILVIGLTLNLNNEKVKVRLQLDNGKTASFDLLLSQLQPLVVLLEKLSITADWQLISGDDAVSNLAQSTQDSQTNPNKLH